MMKIIDLLMVMDEYFNVIYEFHSRFINVKNKFNSSMILFFTIQESDSRGDRRVGSKPARFEDH